MINTSLLWFVPLSTLLIEHVVMGREQEKLCKERREAQFSRWQRLCNSQIGASEWIIKGGEDESYKNSAMPKTPDLSKDEVEDDPRTPRATAERPMDGFAFQQDATTPAVDNKRVPFGSVSSLLYLHFWADIYFSLHYRRMNSLH